MSESSNQTDWASLATEAMDRQRQDESAALADRVGRGGPRLTPRVLVGGAAKLLFLMAAGHFLVNRYGIIHLIWQVLVGWYLVWPTMTCRRSSYR